MPLKKIDGHDSVILGADIKSVETITTKDTAAILRTTAPIVKAAILNGTLPIGFVGRRDGSTKDTIVILKKRLEMYINGEL